MIDRRQIAWGLMASLFASAAVATAAVAKVTESFSDETTTIMVEVPVEVTLDGEPMRGLTIDNFELSDGGKSQDIAGVDVVDLSELTAEPGKPLSSDDLPVVARRHFLLLLDNSFASPRAIARAREAADKLVANDLHDADLVAVATYSLNGGAKILLGFTSDRRQVSVALAALDDPESVLVRADPLRLSVGDMRTSVGDEAGVYGDTPAGERGDLMKQDAKQIQAMADRAQATQGRREITAMTRSFSELAELMRNVDGRKHVVYFSEGFDSSLMLGTRNEGQIAENSRNAQNNALWLVDSEQHFGSAATLNELDDMVTEFRRSDCTVHSVDIGGLRADGGTSRSQTNGKDGLFFMANGTGGDFYENFNDLGGAMGQMLEKTSVTYVLSYQPSQLKMNGKYRKLKVKLKGLPKKARIVHRPGYFAPDPAAERSGMATQLNLAQRIMDGREGGEVEAAVLATPLRTEQQMLGGKAYVPVLIEVDGPSFFGEPASGKSKGKASTKSQAEVFVYALDGQGEIVDFFSQSIGLDPRKAGDSLTRRGFKLYAPLSLERGDYALRVLVRNADSGRTGLRVASVSVRDPEPGTSALLPPLFPESTEEWLLVRGRRSDLAGGDEPVYPFFHDSVTYVPAAWPELVPGQTMPVFLAGYDLGDIQELDSLVLDADGAEVSKPRWKLDPTVRRDKDELERYIAAFEVPDLQPGDYLLNLSVTDREGRSSNSSSLQFSVAAPGTTPASHILALSAPVIFEDAPTAAPTGAAQRSARAEPGLSISMDELRQVYLAALEGLSGGDRNAKLQELASLESRAVAANPARLISRLARTEMNVAKQLARRDLEALVPVILLHQDLYLHHRKGRRPYLGHHSRTMVRQLADHYAREGGSMGSKIVAARALASLGGHLQVDRRSASVPLFERSVALDPSNEAALLGLAAHYEKWGGPYANAVDYLEQLVSHRQGSREGRLRLAVNLLRVASEPGDMERRAHERQAMEHFSQLLEGSESDWIFSLAAQEKAKRLAKLGEIDEARKVLETAIERMPEDQKLHIQLTFLLDKSRRSSSAQKMAEHVTSKLATRAPAARGQYNQWPTNALAADRRELRLGAWQRMPLLAKDTPPVATTDLAEGGDK